MIDKTTLNNIEAKLRNKLDKQRHLLDMRTTYYGPHSQHTLKQADNVRRTEGKLDRLRQLALPLPPSNGAPPR